MVKSLLFSGMCNTGDLRFSDCWHVTAKPPFSLLSASIAAFKFQCEVLTYQLQKVRAICRLLVACWNGCSIGAAIRLTNSAAELLSASWCSWAPMLLVHVIDANLREDQGKKTFYCYHSEHLITKCRDQIIFILGWYSILTTPSTMEEENSLSREQFCQ